MSQELKAYFAATQATARQHEAEVAAMQASVDEIARVRQLLTKLPDKVRHTAMVPFGKHAFFEGELIHTNEFLVGLGCDLRLEASAREAADVLSRRQARAEKALAQALQQLDDLRGRVEELASVLSNEEGEALVDIRQDFEESEALLAAARGAPAPPAQAPARPAFSSSVEVRMASGKASPAKSDSNFAGQQVEDVPAAADDDKRIFARLAELELLEAEAGSNESDDKGADSGSEGEGGGGREGREARELKQVTCGDGAAGPADVTGGQGADAWQGGRGSGGGAVSSASSSTSSSVPAGESCGSLSTSTSAAPANAATVKAPAAAKLKTGTPLKKGFLLGGGGAGSRAASTASLTAPSAAPKAARGAQSSASLSSGSGDSGPSERTSLAARNASQEQHQVEGASLSQDAVTSTGCRTGRDRRVSFADGSVPGQGADDGGVGSRQALHAPAGPLHQQGSAGLASVRPALKQGTNKVDSAEHQGTGQWGNAEGSGAKGRSWAGLPSTAVALEDGGDAAMAMARAREEAFTGVVKERGVGGRGCNAGDAASSEFAGSEVALTAFSEVGVAATKRVSKFKQQRMGLS